MTSFTLISDRVRSNAIEAVRSAPPNWIVTIKEPKRSLEQNARLWAMLADVANARPEGRQWTPETWKSAFLHSLGHQVRFAEGLDGSGPFPMGFSSSALNVKQMADLITVIQEYGDRHEVQWKEVEESGFYERTRE
jgi:hypothetical protein